MNWVYFWTIGGRVEQRIAHEGNGAIFNSASALGME